MSPAVRATGVAKAFERGPVVLRVGELELVGPALVRVEGANGAGKSTLLRLLAGVTRPKRGRVEWTGAGRLGAAPHGVNCLTRRPTSGKTVRCGSRPA